MEFGNHAKGTKESYDFVRIFHTHVCIFRFYVRFSEPKGSTGIDIRISAEPSYDTLTRGPRYFVISASRNGNIPKHVSERLSGELTVCINRNRLQKMLTCSCEFLIKVWSDGNLFQ